MNQALWHINSEISRLLPVELDSSKGKINLMSLCSLISKGTERTVCSGHCDKSFEQAMKVPYMQGSFDFPLTYGYSLVGKIEGESKAIYHMMHPHQSKCAVYTQEITKIPPGISRERACLTSNMETVINAIWDAKVEIGNKILILGFGAIGSLLALTLKDYPGIALEIYDKKAWNLQKSEELGLRVWDGGQDYDLVFHITGQSSGLQQAIDLCRPEGKVIELSWYGNRKVNLCLGSSFHYGRKTIISSQVSSIPQDKAHQWDYSRRKKLAMELLQDQKYDALITHKIPFSESPEFFHKLRKGEEDDGLNWLIDYR